MRHILSLVTFFTTILKIQPGQIMIPITGVFNLESPSEQAFAFAVYKYNKEQNGNFYFNYTSSFPEKMDISVVRRKICEQLENRSVIAFFSGDLGGIVRDVNDIATTIGIPFFTSETVPMEPVNISDYLLTSSTVVDDDNEDLDIRTGGSVALKSYGSYDSLPKKLIAVQSKLNYVIQLRPPVIKTVSDLIVFYGWNNFTYVCNTGEGLFRMQHVLETLHKRPKFEELNVDIRYIPDPQVAAKDLRHLDFYLRSQRVKNILIDFDSQDNLEIFLKKIVLMGMNRHEYNYILTGLGLNEMKLEEFKYSGVKLTGLQIINDTHPTLKEFSNWQKDNLKPDQTNFKVALMVDAINTFGDTISQLLNNTQTRNEIIAYLNGPPINCFEKQLNFQSGTELYKNFKRKPFTVGKKFMQTLLNRKFTDGITGPISFTPSGTRKNVSLRILSVMENIGAVYDGNWTQKTGLKMNYKNDDDSKMTKDEARNLTLRVVTLVTPPFTYYNERKTDGSILTGNDRYSGFAMSLLRRISVIVGFNYEIHEVYDGKYGAFEEKDENGKEIWNGMIGEVLNGSADIVMAPMTISLMRAKVVTFSEPYLTFGISVMIKKPGKKKPGIFSFLLPLSEEVWWCIMAACIVVACGLYIVARISPFEWNISQCPDEVKRVERDFTLLNSLWFSFAAFVQQGVDIAPRSPGARILSSAWWFFTLIMIAYYTANLAAFLTVSRMVTPINGFDDLVKSNTGIEYGPIGAGSTFTFFKTTDLYPFKEMGAFMTRNPHVLSKTTSAGVARVRNSKGKYAFLLESRMNEYHNNQLPCDTMMVGKPFGDKGYGVATPHGFPLSDDINSAILTLRENQEIAQLRKTWWIEKGQCPDDGQKSISDALALINVAGVFYILTAGLTLALFTSILEFYYNARKEYKRHNTSFSDFIRQKARLSIHGPLAEFRQRCRHVPHDNYAVPPPARTINLI